jgi:hypothetical protein
MCDGHEDPPNKGEPALIGSPGNVGRKDIGAVGRSRTQVQAQHDQ